MESYLQQDEFNTKILREVSTLVKKNFKNTETRSSENLQGKLDKIFFRTLRTHKVLADISETTGIKGEIVEAQQKNQPHEGEPKRVNDSELKEPIKNQNEQRKNSKKKQRGKKEVKEIALHAPVDQQLITQKSGGACATSRDIMFYDIPARYSEGEVISAIKQLGNLHRIRIKKHYKYQSVRAEISLYEDYENDFIRDIWKVQLLIGNGKKTQNSINTTIIKIQRSAIALDEEVDDTWIIHGKGLGNHTERGKYNL
ncbi:hypothetical protein RhiirA1_476840 [Rhizophagus irregularis]|uniref:Uncharacterized protein n=1 Tax=Rhizophagus irregularis TaxID=588596 RepID=A0A2N0QUE5_9GLOM|nr:hypothetical protein RhiirA1_476840 [Rhizophagus irregularis]